MGINGLSVELLKARILTRDGRINQDSRRKLKLGGPSGTVIEPLMRRWRRSMADVTLVDVGSGKVLSGLYLG